MSPLFAIWSIGAGLSFAASCVARHKLRQRWPASKWVIAAALAVAWPISAVAFLLTVLEMQGADR